MNFYPKFILRTPLDSVRGHVKSHVFFEALYLSSPTLYYELQKLNEKTQIKDSKKIKISSYKYISRSRFRCTPFGLFAGVSIGDWTSKNEVILDSDSLNSINRKTRLDMNVLYSLSQELVKLPYIKTYLKLYPNSSIYLLGDSYRYVEYFYNNNRRFHNITRVDFSIYLEEVLTKSVTGLTLEQIVVLLVNKDINRDEAIYFVNELISSQLLINQFEPTVTGKDYFEILLINLKDIYLLSKNEELELIINLLDEINVQIKEIDLNGANNIDNYKNVYIKLNHILPQLGETNLFQTDLYKKTNICNLNDCIQSQIKDALLFLNKITPHYSNNKLIDFKKRFIERYEDIEVPVLIALDKESGIGYPSKDNNGVNELVDDIYNFNTNSEIEIKWNNLQSQLLKLIVKSIKENKKSIEISEKDFENIDYSDSILPSSFSVMFKVIDAETNKIELEGIGGSSSINLLGRFSGGDIDLEKIVNEIAQFEQNQMPDKILSEIVHLPESRTGNILARPVFRPYEIPYLAKSSLNDEFQIKVQDLYLKVIGDKIILFDKRLNKEIIPRMGNAHNFASNSLPLYHFLCDLQLQYFTKPFLKFNWGILANQFVFLPRVEYKNTVLSSAKWQLKSSHLNDINKKNANDLEKRNAFFLLKREMDLPDCFLLVDGDNELLINCSDEIAVDSFLDIIKNRNEIVLEEYLFNDEKSLVKDLNKNNYNNECVAIVFNENRINTFIDIEPKTYNSKSFFSIGSEWLYYKIYCGVKTADYILVNKIKEITNYLLNHKIIDKWFFIRYIDSDTHLRIRFHVISIEKYGFLLEKINLELEPLINEKIISKIQTDTYKREINRYGDNSIEFIEELFYIDSVFIIEFLDLLDSDSGNNLRWLIAIRAIDEFLNDFNYTIDKKYALLTKLSLSFFKEHGGMKELKILLDNKYRANRKQVEDILNRTKDNTSEYFPIIELLNKRTNSNKIYIDKLLDLHSQNLLQVGLDDLLSSLMHMNLDRLFMGKNRTNEFVVYDFLARYYKSFLARTKKENIVNYN